MPPTIPEEILRRERLDATWKALSGGQSPRFIQDTMQSNGFDVFVHEWWEPFTPPTPGLPGNPIPRNPLLYLRRSFASPGKTLGCGDPEAECGEPLAECGERFDPPGYPLVNKVFKTVPDTTVDCGEPEAECGETFAVCGNFFGYKEIVIDYIVPDDPLRWPYFLYICGEDFPDIAEVDNRRKDEFEALLLKICPLQQWIGVIVTYT